MRTRRRCLIALFMASAALLWTQETQAQGATRVDTQVVEFDSIRVEGYGDHPNGPFLLPEPLPLDGVTVIYIDGIIFGLERGGAPGRDGIQVVTEIFAGETPVWRTRARRAVGGGADSFAISYPIRAASLLDPPEEGLVADRLVLTVILDSLAGDPAAKTVAGTVDVIPGSSGLRVHAVRGNRPNFDPGRNQQRVIEGLASKTLDGAGTSEWSEFAIDPPVDARNLRYAWTSTFAFWRFGGFETGSGATAEVVLLLADVDDDGDDGDDDDEDDDDEDEDEDDENELRLDDVAIPGLGAAAPRIFSNRSARLIDSETRDDLEEKQIVGFRWRIHQVGPGSTSMALPSPAGQPARLILRFFYDDRDEDDEDGDDDDEDDEDDEDSADGRGASLERLRFRRGDANDDGTVDISDAVTTLGFLFLGGEELACLDSGDANDDGTLDISDAIAALGVLFLGDGTMPAPGLDGCGTDPTDDELDCARSEACADRTP